ncbi:3'(2'),5'-bisphosphate nucleotidase CysQ [Algoriphagus sediminis]|uniref:3'(2'),5'-bisphosphate nucleotidase CysQ n=1 Tax=Algoriphagus sediminis TaxID=3057113 RepID=A0ABT7YEN6_9BACT|nr:3'(2'),5'-bisphosphate nucleotidase CysQ [Algoriphagus sediminis]MDN3204659.1 3'(2'),5'-bisphosphate nucleotidase CysQ [Algoriphagus sediminis]
MIDLKNLTDLAKEASLAAGAEILKIYNSLDFGVESKSDDSPLTKADKAAHQVIVEALSKTNFPILSEEGRDISYEERKSYDYFWMVDPLDGTKEFIKKNGEFTVNIALIKKDKPVMGVVYAPVLDWLYWGNESDGALKSEKGSVPVKLEIKDSDSINTIVASRSHLSQETKEFIDQYQDAEVISMGSSLKLMLVAEGKAQVYPRFAPTMEWDTAAAHGIINAIGGKVNRYPDGSESLIYNKEDLLNPWFICRIA